MNLTDSQDLPYPDENDPRNGALQLQVLAEAIDAKLVAQFAAYRAVVNRPAFIASLTGTQTFASGVSFITWDTFLFNSAITSAVGSSIVVYQTGYWMIGSFMQSNPSGAITANSRVENIITWTADLVLPLGGQAVDTVRSTNFQSSTGGEYQTASLLVRQEYDGSTDFTGGGDISLAINHANLASSVTVATSTILWGFKVCDLEDM